MSLRPPPLPRRRSVPLPPLEPCCPPGMPPCCHASATTAAPDPQRSTARVDVSDLLAAAGVVDMASLHASAGGPEAPAPHLTPQRDSSSPLLDPIDAADAELMALSGGSLLLEQPGAAGSSSSGGGGGTRRRTRTASAAQSAVPLRARGLSNAAGSAQPSTGDAATSTSTSSSSGKEGTTRGRASTSALPTDRGVAGTSASPADSALASSDPPASTSLSLGDDSTLDDSASQSFLHDFTLDTSQSHATFNTTYASVDDSPGKDEAHGNVLPARATGQAAALASQREALADDVWKDATASPLESTPRKPVARGSAENAAVAKASSLSSSPPRGTEFAQPRSSPISIPTSSRGLRSHTSSGLPVRSFAPLDSRIASDSSDSEVANLREQLSASEAINALLTSRIAELEAENAALQALLRPSLPPDAFAAGLGRHNDPSYLAMLSSQVPHGAAFPPFGEHFSPASTNTSVTPDPFSPFTPQQTFVNPRVATSEGQLDSAEEFSSRGGSIPPTPDPGADLSQSPFMTFPKRSSHLLAQQQQSDDVQPHGASALHGLSEGDNVRPAPRQYSSSYSVQLQGSERGDSQSHGALSSGGPFMPEGDGYALVAPQTQLLGLGLDFEGEMSHGPQTSPPELALASASQARAHVAAATYMSGSVPGPDLGPSRLRATLPSAADVPAPRKEKAPAHGIYVPPDILVSRALAGRSQDASITLQQQLKSATPERKAAIMRALEPHLRRLAEDKHGNFLVQRAIGYDAQICWKLKGHFVDLSLSQFGCHVVQRILDEDEHIKISVVEELLSDRLIDTLTSRNSIHVWQKVLEIDWTQAEFRSTVFDVINHAMRGRWAETARDEVGSILVQNIFESADPAEKEGCIAEILEHTCDCARHQWGVYVAQHMIEHGSTEHRRLVFEHLLQQAVPLTLSQYGQKAIMSALKSPDQQFLNAYLDVLCDREGAPGTTGTGTSGASHRRSVLVDVASAPQGLQIVTLLLTSVSNEQRERIIRTVRKNSVFLKGSKAGIKVHQLCERARAFTGY